MRSTLAVGLFGLVAQVTRVLSTDNADPLNPSGCIAVKTVTVTETVSPISSLRQTEKHVTTTISKTVTAPVSTKTIFKTVTDTFSVQPSPVSTSASTDGPFYFSMSGTQTIWVGATPPTSVSLILITSTIDVYPVQTVVEPTAAQPQSTTGLTTTEYVTILSTETETVTASALSITSLRSPSTTAMPKTSSSGRGPYTNNTGFLNATVSVTAAPSSYSVVLPSSSLLKSTTLVHLSVVPPSSTWSLLSLNSTFPATTFGSTSSKIRNSTTPAGISTETASLSTRTILSYSIGLTTTDSGTQATDILPTTLTSVLGVYSSSEALPERAIGDTVYLSTDGTVWSWTNEYSPTAIQTSAAATRLSTFTSIKSSSSPSSVWTISASSPNETCTESSQPRTSPVPSSTSTSNLVSSVASKSPSPAITTYSSTFVSSTSIPAPSSTCLGFEQGDFIVTFDDLPVFGEPPNGTLYPPIMSPYHDLQWSQGYAYVPPPSDPFRPHSGHQMGMFIVDGNKNVHSQNWTGPIPSVGDVNGMFGAGPNYANSAFWFDAESAWVGCANTQYPKCNVAAYGWRLDAASGQSIMEVEQLSEVPACGYSSGCDLAQVVFSASQFTNLTALELVITVGNSSTPQDWYVDDIALHWSNNSCAAIEERDRLLSVAPPK